MKTAYLIAAGAGLGLLLVTLKNPNGVGYAVGAGAVDLVDGVVSGTVYTVGNGLGLPDTRQPSILDQGRLELAAGNYWDASFHLPAGEFISGTWNRLFN